MIKKLEELRNSGSEEGFTLIELMIVVVIIGILAAIAIPIFMNQQKGAIAAGVKSDVKNVNTQIATALVKYPTATIVAGTVTDGAASTVRVGTGTTATTSVVLTDLKVSDPATTITVSHGLGSTNANAWNQYSILGENSNGDPVEVLYSANTGKLTYP